MEVDYLLVTALVSEFGPIAKGLGRGGRRHEDYRLQVNRVGRHTVVLMQLGIGPARARRAMKWAIEQIDPKRVIMLGVAGGLAPDLQRGDIITPDELLHEQAPTILLPTPEEWSQSAVPVVDDATDHRVHRGKMLQVDRVILTPAEKGRLADLSGAVALDMESWSVARVCQEANRPVRVVRFITDAREDTLPPEIVGLVDEAGNPRFVTALGRIVRRPGLLRELLALERSNKQVAARMRAWAESWRLRLDTRNGG